MGDIVLAGPVCRALHRAFPEAEIVFITTSRYAELAAALPGVGRVETIRRRGASFTRDVSRLAEGSWDYLADLQGSPRSAKVRRALRAGRNAVYRPPRFRRGVLIATKLRLGRFEPVPLRYLRAVSSWGVWDDDRGLTLRLGEELWQEAAKRWPVLLTKPYAIIPGAKHATKRWPGEYWAELVGLLRRERPVIVIGGPGDMPREVAAVAGTNGRQVVDLTGRTPPLMTAAVLSGTKGIVSGDTGPMHLAVASGRPLVALFGPTVREFGFFPFRASNARVLEAPLWCRPCSAHGGERCPLGHHRCMKRLTPDQVEATLGRAVAEATRDRGGSPEP